MSGPLIVPTTTTGSGPTFRELYMDLADELGFMQQVAVSTLATNPESGRTVLTYDVQDDEYDESELGGWYLYVIDGTYAGSQRRILEKGHHGTESALMLSRAFPTALAVNTSLLLTSPLPVTRMLGIKGLKQIANEGLSRIKVEGRISFTGTDFDQYSLNSYSWLRDINQTTGLYDRLFNVSTSNANRISGGGYRIAINGADVTLVTSRIYSSSTPFELGVIVPADRLIFDGSAWGYVATPGLVNDTDQAAAPRAWVRAFGMVKALQHLERVLERDPRLTDAEKQRRMAIVTGRKPTYTMAAATIAIRDFPEPFCQPNEALVDSGYITVGPYYTPYGPERVPY